MVAEAVAEDALELAMLVTLAATEDTDEETLDAEDEADDEALEAEELAEDAVVVGVVTASVAEEADEEAVVAVEAIVEVQDTAYEHHHGQY